jgi:alpha-tubulin suppressor-like RCC1 family protein
MAPLEFGLTESRYSSGGEAKTQPQQEVAMTHTACTLTRRLAPLLGPALVVAALGCGEEAESPTAPVPEPALDITPAAALSFRQVSAGFVHTCGVTLDNRAFCWGLNKKGQLGNGTLLNRRRPVAVAGGLSFRQVSAGGDYTSAHTCGVTTADQAYCWGSNADGQLGNGTFKVSRAPVAVAGGLRFRRVSVGVDHTCGVTLDNRAYCWGKNRNGRLGDGTTDVDRPRPVAVSGGLFFLQVSAGRDHTCGVTTTNRVFCWGNGSFGQLGNGTSNARLTPVAVAGGLQFRQADAGFDYSCGVTTDNLAYCWGDNGGGTLGDGTPNIVRMTPTAVVGGLRFRRVSAGSGLTCGVATDESAYCWGPYQVGDGTSNGSLTPAAVAGGLRFRQVDAGGVYACGVTTGNQAFCWGSNGFGQLGDRTTTDRPTPVAVAPPPP